MRKKIVIIIAIILIGAVVFSIIYGLRTGIVTQKEPVSPQKQAEKSKTPGTGEKPEEIREEDIQKPSKTESELKNQARAFIQTYGTYSSDSGYSNLVGLLGFMTDTLRKQTQLRIDAGVDRSQGFFSNVTKVGSIETLSFITDSRALFTAQTQVQEIRKGETNIYQQIVDIMFLNIGDKWLVDEIEFR